MPNLNLSVAVGHYDRTRALIDGAVQIDGVDPVFMQLVPEEIFFRAFRAAEFDICELSMSSYTVKTAQGNCPYIAVPAFVSRAFRHTSIYVRTDRIKKPQDLKGRKVGVPEYQLTANVWARSFLEDDYGVKRSDIHWIRGGIEHAGRPEKITDQPAARRAARQCAGRQDDFGAAGRGRDRRLHRAAAADAGGEGPSAYRLAVSRSGRGGEGLLQAHRLFPDHARARHPPRACREASVAAERGVQGVRAVEGSGLEKLSDTSATKVTLPFVEERLKEARDLMGDDFWSYGVEPNRKVLDYFLAQHHAEGLSSRRVSVDEMFHPSTYRDVQRIGLKSGPET